MDPDEQQRITRLLREHGRIRAAWVFGSVATGTADPTSDLDVAVLADTPLSADGKRTLIKRSARETGRPVDLIDLQATRGPIVDRALQGGASFAPTRRFTPGS